MVRKTAVYVKDTSRLVDKNEGELERESQRTHVWERHKGVQWEEGSKGYSEFCSVRGKGVGTDSIQTLIDGVRSNTDGVFKGVLWNNREGQSERETWEKEDTIKGVGPLGDREAVVWQEEEGKSIGNRIKRTRSKVSVT